MMELQTQQALVLFRLLKQHEAHDAAPLTVAALEKETGFTPGLLSALLDSLTTEKQVAATAPGRYTITPEGRAALEKAAAELNERLSIDTDLLTLFSLLGDINRSAPGKALDWRKLATDAGLDFTVAGILIIRLEEEGLVSISTEDLTAAVTEYGRFIAGKFSYHMPSSPAVAADTAPCPNTGDSEKKNRKLPLLIAALLLAAAATAMLYPRAREKVVAEYPYYRIKCLLLYTNCRKKTVNYLEILGDTIAMRQLTPLGTFPLRNLTPLETGKHYRHLPIGIFCFVSASELVTELRSPVLPLINAAKEREPRYTFEMQRPNDRFFLIGFVDEKTLARIRKMRRNIPIKLQLFSSPYGSAVHIIGVPVETIAPESFREVTFQNGKYITSIDLTATEATRRVSAH